MSYLTLFKAALVRTARLSLDLPEVDFDPARRIDADFQKALPRAIRETLGELRLADITLRRLSTHYRLRPVLERLVGTQAYLTIGWLRMANGSSTATTLFEFTEEWARAALERGTAGGASALSVHAWLTLPSMEIVDLSVLNGAALGADGPQGFRILARHPDELAAGISYIPMLVGDGFLKRTGLLALEQAHHRCAR